MRARFYFTGRQEWAKRRWRKRWPKKWALNFTI
jgi:hypothetical protein